MRLTTAFGQINTHLGDVKANLEEQLAFVGEHQVYRVDLTADTIPGIEYIDFAYASIFSESITHNNRVGYEDD